MAIQGTVQVPNLLGFDINADIRAIDPATNVQYAWSSRRPATRTACATSPWSRLPTRTRT
jgi:hypothetical protein